MNTTSFRSWAEFIQFTGTYEERMKILRSSNLPYIHPNTHRHIMWVATVPPDFAREAMEFYRETKERREISLPNLIVRSINDDVQKTYSANLSSLVENNNFKERELTNVLSIFASKRPDIGYSSGMNKIAGVIVQMFKLESDAFVMFAHTIENVFPKDYFNKSERQLAKRIELRIFALMAESLRPKLVSSLKAIFKPANSRSKQTDFSPFVQSMKRIAEVLFDNMMTTIMVPNEFLRAWDNLYIHGFDFLHKLALTYLSKNERFLKNIIKTETKNLKQGTSVDALLLAGNAAKSKLLKRIERLGIEGLIRKALSKRNYNSLSRDQFYEQASEIERNYIERVIRLKQTREVFRSKKQELGFESVKNIYEKLDMLDKDGTISRDDFIRAMTTSFTWKQEAAINLFASFDQEGELFIDKRELKAGLAVIAEASIEERLELCFISFDENKSGDLDPNEAVDMICIIEKSLDSHSSFFKTQSSSFYDRLDLNADGKVTLDEFLKVVRREPACQPIISFLTALDSQNIDPPALLRQVNIAIDGEYLDSQSPIDRSESTSPVSDRSFDGVNSKTLISRLRTIDEKKMLDGFEKAERRMERMAEEFSEGAPDMSGIEGSLYEEKIVKTPLSSQDTGISNKKFKVSTEPELESFDDWESEPEEGEYGRRFTKAEIRAKCSRLCSKDECAII